MSEALIPREDKTGDFHFEHLKPHLLIEAFDYAVRHFDLARMNELASVPETIADINGFIETGKLRMQHIALPAYEQIFNLYNEIPLDDSLRHRLDGMHQKSLDLIEDAADVRTEIHQDNLSGLGEISGVISEAIFQGLLNKQGSQSEEIVIPTASVADKGSVNSDGKRDGHDFLVYSKEDLVRPLKFQIKTGENYINDYAEDIGVISMKDLIPEGRQYNPRTTLSNALIKQNRFESSPREDALIEEAGAILHRFIKQRRSQSKQD